jgi:hypothetical protein
MAQEELELYFKKKNEYANTLKQLDAIDAIIGDAMGTELYGIAYKVQEVRKNLISTLEMLQKHSLCEHANILKDQWDGHDSHKDYYKDVCNDCGKIMREYSI